MRIVLQITITGDEIDEPEGITAHEIARLVAEQIDTEFHDEVWCNEGGDDEFMFRIGTSSVHVMEVSE